MRQDILNYMLSQNLGVFTTSQELPWAENGNPLYLKNLKKVYVGEDEVTVEPLVTTLNADNIHTETTSVRAYVACDAKQTPPNYNDVIATMKEARLVVTDEGIRRRECIVTRDFVNDVIVTELEYRFTKLS